MAISCRRDCRRSGFHGGAYRAGSSDFPKTTLQYEGDDDEDAMILFLETRKCGQSCIAGDLDVDGVVDVLGMFDDAWKL